MVITAAGHQCRYGDTHRQNLNKKHIKEKVLKDITLKKCLIEKFEQLVVLVKSKYKAHLGTTTTAKYYKRM